MEKNNSAAEILKKMTLEEKLHQLSAQMIYYAYGDYEEQRDPLCGNYRNPGHFMHFDREKPASPKEVAEKINADVKKSIDKQPNGIPPIEHGEALHGAQWGMATCFAQPIGMASTFDPELTGRIADAIGKETACVGVHQALTPVVNIARDIRWGRTVETFGEDVKLCSDMGAAICRGLQKNRVIATPKHFVDNYADGGRDSNASCRNERELREVYLRPFEECVKKGGALGIMASYNSVDGVPAHCSKRMLTDILRDEWGFEGIVVSDYGGVNGVYEAHKFAKDEYEALSLCLKAGLDTGLANFPYEDIKETFDRGLITEGDVDAAVLRILNVKIEAGLFDSPFADGDEAQKIVRCDAHRALALESGLESQVLLKNSGLLPLCPGKVKKIGIFGPGADIVPVGSNYSGPYRRAWEADDAQTPLSAAQRYFPGAVIVTGPDDEIPDLAPGCDAVFYFTSVVEGEGMDRSDIRLPAFISAKAENESAEIVDKAEINIQTDQEQSILTLAAANPDCAVILLNGSPVEMRAWADKTAAILESWYPGEQGAQAIWEIITGKYSPCGKLPVTFPKSVGQLPLFYAHKPSGRGYGYAGDDGRPAYEFGFGLSYTSFEIKNAVMRETQNGFEFEGDITNTGGFDGAEVLQIYLRAEHCETVRPVKELKAYQRVFVKKGETVRFCISAGRDAIYYYGTDMVFGEHRGDFTFMLGVSSENILKVFPTLTLKA